MREEIRKTRQQIQSQDQNQFDYAAYRKRYEEALALNGREVMLANVMAHIHVTYPDNT